MAADKGNKVAGRVILGMGALMTLWAGASLTAGLRQADWQIGELARQYMMATGMIKPIHTMVDFYSHIKGIEYLICVAFFVAFPVFFKYVNKEPAKIKKQVKISS
ncbi:MAG: hypothetical protein ABFS19_07065 [Thermodesulfobacteriota bacterium]